MIQNVRRQIRSELELPAAQRAFGTGWLSGAAGLIGAIAGLLLVICLRHPGVLTVPAIRPYYDHPVFRLAFCSCWSFRFCWLA